LSLRKFYKTNGWEEEWIIEVMSKIMLQKFWLILLVRVGIPNSRKRVVALPCEVSWELENSSCLCMVPLQLGGLKGKKSICIVGWEISMNSRWLASRRRWIDKVEASKGHTLVVGLTRNSITTIFRSRYCIFNYLSIPKINVLF